MTTLSLKELHDSVVAASRRIQPHVLRTPLMQSLELAELANNRVFVKLESEQTTGSFKLRGAFNKLCLLSEKQKNKVSFVTASSGNHALACVYAMKKLGYEGTVYASTLIASAKEDALRRRGAELIKYGTDCVEAENKARQVAQNENKLYISPYNDYDIIAGNGTVAVEIVADLPEVDCVLVPVGGGGMMAGMAAYIKHHNPNIQVIGCQPVSSKVMYESVQAGRIVFEESADTLSDGTAGGVEENAVTFPICRDYVDDWILTSEEDIAKGVRFMLDTHHKVVEGAAGVVIGGYMANAEKFHDKTVALVSCGANIDTKTLISIIT